MSSVVVIDLNLCDIKFSYQHISVPCWKSLGHYFLFWFSCYHLHVVSSILIFLCWSENKYLRIFRIPTNEPFDFAACSLAFVRCFQYSSSNLILTKIPMWKLDICYSYFIYDRTEVIEVTWLLDGPLGTRIFFFSFSFYCMYMKWWIQTKPTVAIISQYLKVKSLWCTS